jgi:hypothetical protein
MNDFRLWGGGSASMKKLLNKAHFQFLETILKNLKKIHNFEKSYKFKKTQQFEKIHKF